MKFKGLPSAKFFSFLLLFFLTNLQQETEQTNKLNKKGFFPPGERMNQHPPKEESQLTKRALESELGSSEPFPPMLLLLQLPDVVWSPLAFRTCQVACLHNDRDVNSFQEGRG